MILAWTEDAWADYLHWQTQDKKTLKRINKLITEMLREPFEGIGKPEHLVGDFSGAWSRRINVVDRIIYTVDGDRLEIISVKDHY